MKDKPMKKFTNGFRVFFVLLQVLFVSMSVCASIHYRCDFADVLKLDTIQSPTGQQFLKFYGHNIWGNGLPSCPEMPYSVVRFLVPDNACNFTVEIDEIGNVLTYDSNLPVYPVQEAISINDYSSEMFTEPDYEAYDNFNSSYKAEVTDDSWIEGRYHIVAVSLYPVSCSSENKKVSICQDMSITLKFEEKSTPSKKRYSGSRKGFVNISNIVVNPESVDFNHKKSIPSVDDEYVEPDRYYIISEKSLLPALEDLVAWKTQKGYIVTLKSIEDILEDSRYKVGSSTGIVDEAASLRKYLQDEENEYGSFFCLLVGDHKTKMPIRKVREYQTNNPNGDSYVPTDNYFSNLSEKDWGTIWDNNGLYVCESSDVSYSPDIYVGRLLCHTEDQILDYTSKLTSYEIFPERGDFDYLDHASMTVQFDGRNYYRTILSKMNDMFSSVDCLLDGLISNDNAYGSPSSQEMLNAINISGYCSLIGHGEPGTIACSGRRNESVTWEYVKALNYYEYNDNPSFRQTGIKHSCNENGIDLLTNFNRPSVIYTLSCTTCPFDVYVSGETVFDIPQTMASSYTVGGLYGGVAYLGNTREGYFSTSSVLEGLFLDNIKQTSKIGIAEAMSKYLFSSSNHVRNTHNLIGDPEFEMWTGMPKLSDVKLDFSDDYISLIGIDQIGSRAVVNDGSGNISVFDLKKQVSHNLAYADNNDRMVAVGIYKTGYLPIVTLLCDNQSLTNCVKSFVVRDAKLGFATTKVNIGAGARVSIRTIDRADCGKSLSVTNGGVLSINSDKAIDITGSSISSGGKMTVKGEEIHIANGFSVEKGGIFSINKQ